ncbi:hypothetical protein [Xanthomarina spongicola]|uniref:Uncharacterized protein n=1 Tax=Xanthomarina spongicola TaxID=570520 RepID=A0A316DM68_9FLAO|nr:hypothetical protein [Xanthomarina spongicola]PWK19244.1 hypothetical protein LX78_01725 [Xanthomarina spongicola]
MKRICLTICFFTLLFSCNSDEDIQDHQQEEANFYALTVGNSWVYKNYRYNLNTELYEDTGVIDSINIIGTEQINENTYYKFRRWTTRNETNIAFCNPNGEHFELLRDSLGYLIRDDGSVKFVNNNFNERQLASDIWGTIYEKLVEGETNMSVEAGDFYCINSERYARDTTNEELPGLDRFYYSDGMGLILDTSSFVNNPIHSIERRLDSYFVQ